jgi:hypothetical protein
MTFRQQTRIQRKLCQLLQMRFSHLEDENEMVSFFWSLLFLADKKKKALFRSFFRILVCAYVICKDSQHEEAR